MESLLPPTEYRQGANAFVLSADNHLLLVQLVVYGEDEWGLPGGGSDEMETPQATVYREIAEEVGIAGEDLSLLGMSSHVLQYDFPDEMVGLGGTAAQRYRGQQKHQFVFRYVGSAELTVRPGEVRAYRWVPIGELPDYLKFPGQFDNAMAVLMEFGLADIGKGD